jgi:hypothetical protein
MEKYTTQTEKEKIINDKEISQEEKDKENKKTILSDDAFAVCDIIESLTSSINKLKFALMK